MASSNAPVLRHQRPAQRPAPRSVRAVFAPARLLPGLAALTLAGCGGMASNRSVNSIHVPVVEQASYSIDLVPVAGGLPDGETRRLAAWLDALALRYGDRVVIDDASGSPSARVLVSAFVAGTGLVPRIATTAETGAAPGSLRVLVTRAHASVPGCPDWSAKSDFNFNNATSSNYGCAINGNLAAMVADPGHLLHGDAIDGAAGSDDAGTMRSRKAIEIYRDAAPSGANGLKQQQTTSNGN